MFGDSKKREAMRIAEEKDLNKWKNLTIRLRSRMPDSALYRVDHSGNSLLIFISGMLAFPGKDYKCDRADLTIIFPIRTEDEITIVKLDNQESWRLTFNDETYKMVTVQGDKKILEL